MAALIFSLFWYPLKRRGNNIDYFKCLSSAFEANCMVDKTRSYDRMRLYILGLCEYLSGTCGGAFFCAYYQLQNISFGTFSSKIFCVMFMCTMSCVMRCKAIHGSLQSCPKSLRDWHMSVTFMRWTMMRKQIVKLLIPTWNIKYFVAQDCGHIILPFSTFLVHVDNLVVQLVPKEKFENVTVISRDKDLMRRQLLSTGQD